MRRTKNEISKIIELRSTGHSIPEISRILNLPKTTVFRYAKDVEIRKQFLAILLAKRGGSTRRRLEAEQKYYEEGKKFIGILSERDKILLASALYWGEGNKKDLIITNTNPHIIKIFLAACREIFKINEESIRVSLRLYEDLDIDESLSFWSNVTKIHKSQLSTNILAGRKSGKLRYGMCRLRIKKGGNILKQINGINKSIADAFQT